MSLADQTAIIDDADAGNRVRVQTCGRTIRPFLALPHALVDECKLTVRENGLSITTIDPANVVLLHVEVDATVAFDDFTVTGEPPFKIGVTLDTLRSHLTDARLGRRTNDAVALEFDQTRTRVEIQRDYTTTTVDRASEFLNIDTDSVRAEPDDPELDLDGRADVDVAAFKDTIDACTGSDDTARFTDADGDFIIASRDTTSDGDVVNGTVATFRDATTDPLDGDGSVFTLVYLEDIADALSTAKIDQLGIQYDSEFPALLTFERHLSDSDDESDQCLYEGQYLIAPQITNSAGSQEDPR